MVVDAKIHGMFELPYYKEHWIEIDEARLERYQRMFEWNPDSAILYEPADIQHGQVVADFGCGPGHTAIEKWQALVSAASRACSTPDIGRKLSGYLARAGFQDIHLEVITWPDLLGRLLPMVRNMAGYARGSGDIAVAEIDATVSTLECALDNGTYLMLAPQFVVVGIR